jgi:hypothetical protein
MMLLAAALAIPIAMLGTGRHGERECEQDRQGHDAERTRQCSDGHGGSLAPIDYAGGVSGS